MSDLATVDMVARGGVAPSDIPGAPRKPLSSTLFDLLLWGGLALILIASFGKVDMQNFGRLFSGSSNISTYGADLLRPQWDAIFPPGDFWTSFKHIFTQPTASLAGQMWLTVQIALWGTFLAVFIALPLSLMASRNIAPGWLVFIVRRIMDLLRSIPDLVIATLFIVAVGLGPLAGVLALALNTGGVLAKLFSEAVESIDKGPVEGVRATGAGKLHEIVWGVLPQVAPLWTSFALYRFESNSRSATVLGLIGAGGIGQVLFDSMNAFDFRAVSAIVIIVVIAVTLIDTLSQIMRRRLL